MYHAHARFLDKDGNRITVPAPCDKDTPNAQWWYDYIAENALAWSKAGFTAVMFPPPCKTLSGNKNTGDGYGVFDHYDIGWKNQMWSVETRFGNREQLQRAIAVCNANGLDVYTDAVMHQVQGSNGGDGVYSYLGADGKPGVGRFPKHPGCFRGNPPRRPEDAVPVPYYDYPFGDEFVYQNCDPPRYTTKQMIAWGGWLTHTLGIDGYRVDDTKGTWVPFVYEWMTTAPMNSKFCAAEYFDGDPNALRWWCQDQMKGRSCVYDFTLHWGLQDMCSGGNMHRMNGRGYAAVDPMHAVTFVDNPDTDVSGGQNIIGSKLLAYAFILTTEGYPAVYHKDYAQAPGCYGLKPYIDNLVWIHENLANGGTATRWIGDHVIVLERLGSPGLLTGISNDSINATEIVCYVSWPPGTRLHDYTGHHEDVWVWDDHTVRFQIPSNYFGGGRSYVCFAPAGLDRPITRRGRAAIQSLYGAADLDIPPLTAGRAIGLPRLALQAGSACALRLAPAAGGWPAGCRASLALQDASGHLVGSGAWTEAGRLISLRAQSTGWHSLTLTADGLDAPMDFALTATYTAPQAISRGG